MTEESLRNACWALRPTHAHMVVISAVGFPGPDFTASQPCFDLVRENVLDDDDRTPRSSLGRPLVRLTRSPNIRLVACT